MEDTQVKPYATWTVDGKEYKLKLDTAGVIKLEEAFKTNLVNILTNSGESIPALTIMLRIVHQAIVKYEHGVKLADVQDIFDKYLAEGGDQTSFLTDVVLPIYQTGGFFPKSMSDNMEEKMQEMKDELN